MSASNLESRDLPQRWPIVGIGASAGGLEAVTELLTALPADAGLALLIVQHLDPARTSLLSDILSRHTAMPVAEAVDKTLIEINHVYVIPPNTSMTVVSERLRLKPRSASIGPPMPVDDLLDSLAADQGANAIGVVLSGSGTDGAIGLQAIKGCGGITFAQDSASARFSSMPQAAVGLGSVDRVMTPAAIAGELLRIGRQPVRALPDDAGAPDEEAAYRTLFRHLQRTCGIDFSHYKRGTVDRRLQRRLTLHALTDMTVYLQLLESDPGEATALCRDLLIRYTEFFRDAQAFDALGTTVFPRLLKRDDAMHSVPLRIWVPGCATGEEVYSIAICLAECLATDPTPLRQVQIFGTDISEEALEVARAGRYIENIARSVSVQRLSRFFVKEGDHFQIAKSLRDWCTFARQNVVYDPPFSRIDLISCRNLLIYFDPVLQKRVMRTLHFALRREGVLMLGPSETVGVHSELFELIAGGHSKLFTKKPGSGHVFAPPTALAPRSGETSRAPRGTEHDSAEAIRGEIQPIVAARYTPAYVLCDAALHVLEFHGDTSAFLVNPPGPPTNELQRLARPGVLLAVRDAMRHVRATGVASRHAGVRVEVGTLTRLCDIEVIPLGPQRGDGRLVLVCFTLREPAVPSQNVRGGGSSAAPRGIGAALLALIKRSARGAPRDDDTPERETERLSDELRSTREHMRVMLEEHEAAIEELKTLEEETQSSNEEFQSTNEELETAKEEMQSMNEELFTANDELRFRNRELKRVHDLATQARDYADALVETIAQPLLVLDAELRVERANQAFYDAFNTAPDRTLHTALYALGSGQWDVPALRALLEEVLPRRTRVRDYELTADFPQLGSRTMRLNAARVAWPDHSMILLTIDDVTERRRAVARLQTADRQKDEFLAMLAHELRNPLAAMGNAVAVWKHAGSDPTQKLQALETMERQLHNQVHMIDDLLDVSRITRGKVTLRLERVDLVQTVRQVHETLREQIAEHGHEVTLALPSHALFVEGDAARLEKVISNLHGNAIKYTPPHGHIEVELKRQAGDAVLSIADSGIGMSEQFLTEIFGIFVQAERSADRSIGGLGIGLAVVRRLIELHGGTVQAESAGLTHGSRFTVRLPARRRGDEGPAEAVVPPSPAVAQRSRSGASRRVLVIDDNADAANSIATLLELDGHDVHVANDGPAALTQARASRPDVVLLDIGLPGMDGFEVCRALRALPGAASMLIIALSGYGQRADVDKAQRAGFDRHFTKPPDLEQILSFVKAGK
jgi:two-component system CheB/CheR fusion protein